MARKTQRAPLVLSDADRQMLTALSGPRTAPVRETERARVLLHYAEGTLIADMQRQLGISRPTIYKCIDKALSAGVQVGLKDTFHRPKEPEILADAKAWVVHLACTKPKDVGLAAELWTLSALVRQVRKGAVDAGFPRLAAVGKTTVWRILNEQYIKPHPVRYDLEKRDPEFDRKMREVLMVYQQAALYAEGPAPDGATPLNYTVSVDEKPGVQALISGADRPRSSAPPRQAILRGPRLRVCSPRHPFDPRGTRLAHEERSWPEVQGKGTTRLSDPPTARCVDVSPPAVTERQAWSVGGNRRAFSAADAGRVSAVSASEGKCAAGFGEPVPAASVSCV